MGNLLHSKGMLHPPSPRADTAAHNVAERLPGDGGCLALPVSDGPS